MSKVPQRTRTHATNTSSSRVVTSRGIDVIADAHERVSGSKAPRDSRNPYMPSADAAKEKSRIVGRNKVFAAAVGITAVVGLGVGLFAKSKIDEHKREISKYQLDQELLLDENFNSMTDEELIDAGYTVLRAGEGEILSEFGERVGAELAVDSELAMELIQGQGRVRDGDAAFGAGERFIFEGAPEQTKP